MVATRIGPGQRTIAVPIRRQPRLAHLAFGVQQTEAAADDDDRGRQRQ